MTLRTLLVRTAAGLASLAAFPGVAVADAGTQTPVAIDSCSMSEQTAVPNMERSGSLMSTASGLTIVYTIERDVAATQVDFRVRYGGHTLTLADRGSFAPHVKLTRGFSHFSVIFAGSPADCDVTAVRFADGSRWDASVVQPPSASNR